MSEKVELIEVTDEDFAESVLRASERLPVLVDFWAAWCAPCRALAPVLARLAGSLAGALRVAKLDTDANPRTSAEYGVRSLPTVKLFVGGRPVDEFVGALPEREIRAFLEPWLPRPSDAARAQARELRERGAEAEAVALLERALAEDPDNPRLAPELAGLLLEAGELDRAERVLRELPVALAEERAVRALAARIGWARVAAGGEDSATLEAQVASGQAQAQAHHRLGARKLLTGDHEAALEHFLAIVRLDRRYGEDAGRKAMLEVFEMLGPEDARVRRYRGLLSAALH